MYFKIVLIFAVIAQAYSSNSLMNYPSPLKYFNQTSACKITWSHRTNSQEALKQALNDSTMMIEADVLMGKVTGGGDDDIPIMAHPPDETSDLSLQDFLTQVQSSSNKKGIKLDFKNITALEPSLKLVESTLKAHDRPLMLNADILPGPVNDTVPLVTANEFLTKCKDLASSATLSVGWTTNIPENYTGDMSYEKKYAEAMESTLKGFNISQPLTFPVRAAMCRLPHDALTELVGLSPDSTLTVWSVDEDADYMDYKALVHLQHHLGHDKVYFDMPDDQMDKLAEAMGAAPGTTAALSVMLASLVMVWLFV